MNLGRLEKAFHAKTSHLWLMPLIAAGPLLMFLLAAILSVDDFRQGSGNGLSGLSNYVICLGILGILIAILTAMWWSDFREWRRSRTVRLNIYENGFSWENDAPLEMYRWDQIETIRMGKVYHSSTILRGMISVIRAITIKGGRTIDLPEVLDLRRITEILTAKKHASDQEARAGSTLTS